MSWEKNFNSTIFWMWSCSPFHWVSLCSGTFRRQPQAIYYQNSFWVPQALYLQHHRKAFLILPQQFQRKFLILLKSVAKLISSDYHFYADIIFFIQVFSNFKLKNNLENNVKLSVSSCTFTVCTVILPCTYLTRHLSTEPIIYLFLEAQVNICLSVYK